jgi:hypothetical protein
MWDNLRLEENRPFMQEDWERWMQLCALAAVEQDSDKRSALTRELNRLFAEKERRRRTQKRRSQTVLLHQENDLDP